jgi:hypothetical protein
MSQPKMTRGTQKSVACPHCGRANDFRGLHDYGMEVGASFKCDHCDRLMELVKVEPVTVLYLRQK